LNWFGSYGIRPKLSGIGTIYQLDGNTPSAQNDLRPGGKLLLVMGLKDGSFSFDFEAVYDEIRTHEFISYTLTEGRRSEIHFSGTNPVTLTETFEPNNEDPVAMQRDFCQAVLTSFKRHAEASLQ
jgi:uncharacterized protein YndB with AHSA1/START domain